MTDEAAGDIDSLPELGKYYDAARVGNAVHETTAELKAEINALMMRIQGLLPYLTDVHYTCSQQQAADREIKRLSPILDEKIRQYQNTLVSAQTLQDPVLLNT